MKKITVFFALLVVMSLVLAACAPAAPATAAGPVEITFWSWVPHIEDQVEAFNASQTEIKVNYVRPAGGREMYNKLKVALQANADIPDVVQIEYQLVPSFIAQDALLDLTAYGANDDKDKFVPWTWAQVSQGKGVYAYPQDAGPMVMFCNDAILEKSRVTAPKTWDEFAASAEKMHTADPNVYLSNFTSPEATKVAKFWGDLINSGNLSPVDTYTNDWNTALGNGSVACWPTGAWGTFISSSSPDFAGKWSVYPMPQWTEGGSINGNYGGSAIAATKASAHPEQAAAFVKWLNVDAKVTLDLTNPDGAGLFPVTESTLADKAWKDVTYEYWSGQAIHQTMADAAQQVDVNFAWSPLTDFVFQAYTDEITRVKAGEITFEEAFKNVQDKTATYGKDQGFTITTP